MLVWVVWVPKLLVRCIFSFSFCDAYLLWRCSSLSVVLGNAYLSQYFVRNQMQKILTLSLSAYQQAVSDSDSHKFRQKLFSQESTFTVCSFSKNEVELQIFLLFLCQRQSRDSLLILRPFGSCLPGERRCRKIWSRFTFQQSKCKFSWVPIAQTFGIVLLFIQSEKLKSSIVHKN